MTDLSRELGKLGAWVRLHYVYPYPHVDNVIPLMAEGLVLPYLDIPFQHASPDVLRRMRRPANDAKVLQRIRNWREQVPDLAIRSSFVVGFPGETDQDFAYLLNWLEEAQLDRVGAFKFEPVEGAPATSMDDQIPDDLKTERYEAVMALSARISAAKLAAKVGPPSTLIDRSMIDAVDGAISTAPCRQPTDRAPRPTLPRSTARSTCAMPAASSPATSLASASRMPTSMTSTACRWRPSPPSRRIPRRTSRPPHRIGGG